MQVDQVARVLLCAPLLNMLLTHRLLRISRSDRYSLFWGKTRTACCRFRCKHNCYRPPNYRHNGNFLSPLHRGQAIIMRATHIVPQQRQRAPVRRLVPHNTFRMYLPTSDEVTRNQKAPFRPETDPGISCEPGVHVRSILCTFRLEVSGSFAFFTILHGPSVAFGI